MSNPRSKGNGKTVQWLRDRANYSGDDCLIWPFNRISDGYGALGYLGDQVYAHRFMCELIHGAPPTPKHRAAHSCGRGQDGCVNPKHLSWKTNSENQLDRRAHGTAQHSWWGNKGKLSPADVIEIRRIGRSKTQAELAAMFNCTRPTIHRVITGKTWTNV